MLPTGRILRGSTLAGERGVGRVPIPTRGHTLWYSLYIRTLWYKLRAHLDLSELLNLSVFSFRHSAWVCSVAFLFSLSVIFLFSKVHTLWKQHIRRDLLTVHCKQFTIYVLPKNDLAKPHFKYQINISKKHNYNVLFGIMIFCIEKYSTR